MNLEICNDIISVEARLTVKMCHQECPGSKEVKCIQPGHVSGVDTYLQVGTQVAIQGRLSIE